jgi:hypothetical protein
MALGLVGGALHSPYSGATSKAPVTAQAVVSQHLEAYGLDRPNPALIRPDLSSSSSRSASRVVPAAVTPSIAEKTPLAHTCVAGKVGSDDCVGGGHAGRLWLNQALPDNPTGVHYVGVESSKIDCTPIPNNPVISCTPGTPSEDKS